jgi:hypothetical protein
MRFINSWYNADSFPAAAVNQENIPMCNDSLELYVEWANAFNIESLQNKIEMWQIW